MDYEYKKTFLINAAFTVLIGAIVYFISKFMLAYLLPFLISAVLSYILSKPAEFIGKKTGVSTSVWRCILLVTVYLLLMALLTLAFWMLFKYSRGFISTAKDYITSGDNVFHKVSNKISQYTSDLPNELKEPIDSFLSDLPARAALAAADLLTLAVSSLTKFLPAFLISSVVTVVASFYVAKDYKRLVKFLKNMLGDKRFSKICEIKDIFMFSVLKMSGGYLIMALIVFLISWLGFSLIGVDYGFLISLLVAIADLLPVLGAGTVLLPWAAVMLLTGNIKRGVALIILYGAITIIRNFAEPKIIGKRLDVNPLLMLITVFVGLRIGGIAGMFILPLSVIVLISYYKKEMEKEIGDTEYKQ